jgi:hypothetical protein
MPIDTTKVSNRRAVRLPSLDAYRAEVRRLAAAERAGRVKRLGNWTVGQTFHHLAFWLDTVFDGPPGPPPPWIIRLLGPFLKKRFLKGLPAGFRMPKVEAGTYGTEVVSLDDGERELLAAIDRLERHVPPPRHFLFGRMSREDWSTMHLRHAELHLSFLDG